MNARKRLERELTLVLGQLRQMDAATSAAAAGFEPAAGVDVDLTQGNRPGDIDLLTRERHVERVERLHDALDRVEDGSYGICIDCDVTIEAGRLKARPETDTCLACQDRREPLTPSRRVA
jgi:DnaK suppressor protein